MSTGDKLYLDYNATTPPFPEVIEAIRASLESNWQNPSTKYPAGIQAKAKIEEARKKIASFLGVTAEEIIFTSGGTESNHMVFNSITFLPTPPHVITSNIEHDNVVKTLRNLEQQDLITLTVIPVSPVHGTVQVSDVMAAIRPSTRLITLMLANNETGAVFPIGKIVDAVRNLNRREKSEENRILIHTDACQAIGKAHVDLHTLGVDYASVAGHKFYGPRFGFLFAKTGAPLNPLFFGGKQERSLRPGTENTAMIVGMGKAAEILSSGKVLLEEVTRVAQLRDELETSLKTIFKEHPIGNIKPLFYGRDLCCGEAMINEETRKDSVMDICQLHRLPNTSSVVFQGPPWFNSDHLLAQLPMLEATRGAACAEKTQGKVKLVHGGPEGSQVLRNCGYGDELAATALRLSLGRLSTSDQVKKAVLLIHAGIAKLVSASLTKVA